MVHSLPLPFLITTWLLFSGAVTGSAFQFPKIKFVGIPAKEDPKSPQIIVQNGPVEADNLRLRLEKHCNIEDENISSDKAFRWKPQLQESYDVADVIFQELALASQKRYNEDMANEKGDGVHQLVLSFPSMKRPEDLGKLSEVLQSKTCKQLIGLEDACAELYPSAPAPYIRITLSTDDDAGIEVPNDQISQAALPDSAVSATNDWVNNFLGRYRLCPYTSSVTRAAVGLSSLGVPVGGVHVQVANTHKQNADNRSYNILRAAQLVSEFWSEVATLMQSPQEEWATSLVVFPEFDNQFQSFVDICDNIVEPTVVATQSTEFIGRAWFHPRYDADMVGHTEVIPGHAVPHKMVEGFMTSLSSSSRGKIDDGLLEYNDLVEANNRVRQTPHATINILRRSQLTAAGEYEKGLGEKKPKANSIYVRNAVRLSKALTNKGNL